MLKQFFCLVVLFFCLINVFSSEPNSSELKNTELNFEEFFYYRDIKLPQNLQNKKKQELSKKIEIFNTYQKENNPKEDEILFDIISDYFELFDFNNAFKYTQILENVGKIKGDYDVVGKANLILGDIFNYLGMPEAAAYYYFLADKFGQSHPAWHAETV